MWQYLYETFREGWLKICDVDNFAMAQQLWAPNVSKKLNPKEFDIYDIRCEHMMHINGNWKKLSDFSEDGCFRYTVEDAFLESHSTTINFDCLIL